MTTPDRITLKLDMKLHNRRQSIRNRRPSGREDIKGYVMDTVLFNSIIDILPDAIFAIDKNGKVIAWNRSMEAMTGIKREDVLDNEADYAYAVPFYGTRRPLLIDLALHANQDMQNIESCYDYVKRLNNSIYAETFAPELNDRKGAYLWGVAAPLLDEGGNYIGAIEAIRDITEIKERENALRQSEEKYRAIFNAVNDAIIIIDKETQAIFDVNDRMGRMFGYTYEEALKLNLNDLSAISSSNSEDSFNNLFCEVSKKSPHATEWISKDKDGHQFMIEMNMRCALIDGHERLLITARDIEDRKMMEKHLEYEKQRLHTLTEEAPFGIVFFNGDGQYIYVNTKFKEMFGYDLNDIPDGKTWFRKAYPDPEYRHRVIGLWLNDVEKFRRDTSTREGKQWTFTVTCKDNKQKIISFIVVKLPTGEYLLTLEDITEQKMAEQELKKRKEELDIKSSNLEELNAALKVLLRERENDKTELESRILNNVKELVVPYIEKLKRSHLGAEHMTYVDIIETNLNDIVSPFLQRMGLKFSRLTPTEIEIANLIKHGKQTKDICNLFCMSKGAINFHRNNIRKKLGLNKKKINLRSFLLSIT